MGAICTVNLKEGILKLNSWRIRFDYNSLIYKPAPKPLYEKHRKHYTVYTSAAWYYGPAAVHAIPCKKNRYY